MLYLMVNVLIGLNKFNELFWKDMVDIFIIGSSLEIIIYVLRNKFLDPTKELGPFIITSFVENTITIHGF
jgi:hypothetical protein